MRKSELQDHAPIPRKVVYPFMHADKILATINIEPPLSLTVLTCSNYTDEAYQRKLIIHTINVHVPDLEPMRLKQDLFALKGRVKCETLSHEDLGEVGKALYNTIQTLRLYDKGVLSADDCPDRVTFDYTVERGEDATLVFYNDY